jgi:tetratricopeptide (TPR) repeat protein
MLLGSNVSQYELRYNNATALKELGHLEDAIREFHLLATETNDIDWKAATLMHEANCMEMLNRFDEAKLILKVLSKLDLSKEIVLNISLMSARVLSLNGEHKKAARQYDNILHEYTQLLDETENRKIYEDIRYRLALELHSLHKYKEAITIYEEVVSFSTLAPEKRQLAHQYCAGCYEELNKNTLAIREYLRVINFNLGNDTEADAHYRVARLYFEQGAFAHAKNHLEIILRDFKNISITVPLEFVYRQMSRACHYLGEEENARHYELMETRGHP